LVVNFMVALMYVMLRSEMLKQLITEV